MNPAFRFPGSNQILQFPTERQKIPHPVPKFWWILLPGRGGSSQIPFPVKIFCVFPNPAPYFNQIPESRKYRIPKIPFQSLIIMEMCNVTGATRGLVPLYSMYKNTWSYFYILKYIFGGDVSVGRWLGMHTGSTFDGATVDGKRQSLESEMSIRVRPFIQNLNLRER